MTVESARTVDNLTLAFSLFLSFHHYQSMNPYLAGAVNVAVFFFFGILNAYAIIVLQRNVFPVSAIHIRLSSFTNSRTIRQPSGLPMGRIDSTHRQ